MKVLISFFSFFLLLAGCQDEMPDPVPNENPPAAEVLQYLALGDSYTIGESVEATGRWPNQLADSLQSRGVDMRVAQNIAVTGWTTRNLLDGMEQSELADSYDLVSLLIGVNNFYQGRSIEEYEQEFNELLDRALALTGNQPERLIVLSIPDYAYTPFGANTPDPEAISVGIDAFNAVNRSNTEARGIAYFDITPISRQGLDEPDLVASDGLHPSSKQYTAWVSAMVDDVRRLFP